MKTVFITIFDIFQLKNFFYTDFYTNLKDKVRIVIVCNERNVDYFKSVFTDNPNVIIEGVDISLHPNRVQFLFMCARQASLKTRSGDSFFLQRARVNGKWKKYLFYKFFYTFFSNRLGHATLKFFEDRLFPPGKFQYLFDKYKPDLVFSTNLISTIDFRLLKDAKRNKVRSITNLKSWDNSTMKGYLVVNADKMIVMNEIQKSEMMHYHHVPSHRLAILGNPGFDTYYNNDGLMSRDEFCRFAGLDPAKKIIFINISAVFINPYPEDPILYVDRWINEDKIKFPAQILISPRSKYGFKETMLQNSKNIVIHTVTDDIVDGAKNNLRFSKAEFYDLKNCLRHADVIITTGSTLGMEAVMMDTPSINIFFDFKPVNYWLSAKVRETDEYIASTIKAGGVYTIRSPEELLNSINDYLVDPTRDKEKRQLVARQQSQFCDAKSGQRIADYILANLA